MKKLIASSLAAALVLLSPGLPCYQALAAGVNSGSSGGKSGGNRGKVPKIHVVPARLSAAAPGGSGLSGAVPKAGSPSPTAAPAVEAAKALAAQPSDGTPAKGPSSGLAGAREKIAAVEKTVAAGRLAQLKSETWRVISWAYDKWRGGAGASDESAVAAQDPVLKPFLAPVLPGRAKARTAVPAPAAPAPGLSWRDRLKGLFDFSGYTVSELAYIKAQVKFAFGLSIYIPSLTLLVASVTGQASDKGVLLMAHYWTFAAASLFAGEVVRRSPPLERVLHRTGAARAAVYGLIGALGLAGGLSWPTLLMLAAVNGYLISFNHLGDIDSDGAAKVIPDEAKREKAVYLYRTLRSVMLLAVPPVMGLFMDRLDSLLHPGAGAQAGFLALAAVMASAASTYRKYVRASSDEAVPPAPRGWREAVAGLRASVRALRDILLETSVRARRTVRAVLGNRLIETRLAVTTILHLVEDSIFRVALPAFVVDTLRTGNFGNNLVFSATYLGALIASLVVARTSRSARTPLEKYRLLKSLSLAAALVFIPSVALWAYPTIWAVLPVAVVLKLLYDPIEVRMQTVMQTAVNEDPRARAESENIFALQSTLEVIAAGLGPMIFAGLFRVSGPGSLLGQALGDNAAMKIVTLALMGLAPVYLLGLRWMKPQILQSGRKVHRSAPGRESEALALLHKSLEKLGLPSLKLAVVDKPVGSDRLTVAFLAPASVHKIAIMRELGRQSPGDGHLVLDPSWMIQERGSDGKNRLWLTKGVLFEGAGQAVLVEYKAPRQVRYFFDSLTPSGNDRDDGLPLEESHDAPMSSSAQLEKVTNDKLLTRLLLAAHGVGVPASLGLVMGEHIFSPRAAEIGVPGSGVHVAAMPKTRAEVLKSVEAFLADYPGVELVVKPSGPRFHSTRGVRFFTRDQVEEITDHVLSLSQDAQMPPDAILADARLSPPPVYLRFGEFAGSGDFAILRGKKVSLRVLPQESLLAASPKEKKDWNFRVLAARTPWNGAVATGIFARAGAWGVPTAAEPANAEDAAAFVKFEDIVKALREQHGLLKTDEEVRELFEAIKALGVKSLLALSEYESVRPRAPGEPTQAQTDYIGIDVMVELEGGRLVPKVIEVNDHDAGGQPQLDAFYPERAGEHSREWAATMLQRARRDALRGKRIVVVGAGYEAKREIYERARELGVELVLIDKGYTGLKRLASKILSPLGLMKDHWARDLVSEFIPVDTSERKEALALAREKLLRSARKNGQIDGITTFWEDDVVLTAELARELGLPYHPVEAVRAARSKLETRRVLKERGLPTPAFVRLDTSDDQVRDLEAFEQAASQASFPAVIKPARGASAEGAVKVSSLSEARRAFVSVRKLVRESPDPIYKQGRELVLEQYLDGREYDVDIVLQGGKAVFSSITDNKPTREPHFIPTGASLPSRLLTPGQQAEVVRTAIVSARALGLTDGVIHVEGKYTTEGARIIEVNARMGGAYVRDWVKTVWGVDLAEEQLLIAAGIESSPFKPEKPLTYLEGEFINSAYDGVFEGLSLDAEAARHTGLHRLTIAKKAGSRVSGPFNGRLGMLSARGESGLKAREHLELLRTGLTKSVRPVAALKGKTLLYVVSKIGGRDYLYDEVFRLAKKEGFRVALLGYGKDKAHAEARARQAGFDLKDLDYIAADIGSHDPKAVAETVEKAKAYARTRPVSAVKTFLNAYALLAADLAHVLRSPDDLESPLRGYTPQAVLNAHDKTRARAILNQYTQDGVTYPLRLPAHRLAGAAEAVARFREITAGGRFKSVVIKPVMGGGGWGVKLDLADEASVEKAAKDLEGEIQELIRSSPDKAKSKQLDTNPGIMIEAQIPYGVNGDAEIISHSGGIDVKLSYNPPAFEGHHERGTTYPMGLPEELKTLVRERMTTAYKALGLTSGNAHFEFILTKLAGTWEVFLIEANARMGGADVYASVKETTGVDLMEEGVLDAFGLPTSPEAPSKSPLLQHRFLLASVDGTLKSIAGLPGRGQESLLTRLGLLEPKVFLSETFVEPGASVKKGDWLGNITVRGEDEREAQEHLFKLLDQVQIEVETPDGRLVRQTGLFSHDAPDGRKLASDVIEDLER